MSKRQRDVSAGSRREMPAGPSQEMEAGPSRGPQGPLLPCYPCVLTPGGTARIQGDPTLCETLPNAQIRSWIPPSTPTLASPVSSDVGRRQAKKNRRSLSLTDTTNLLQDSGSDDDSNSEDEMVNSRNIVRCMRNYVLEEREDDDDVDDVDDWSISERFSRRMIDSDNEVEEGEDEMQVRMMDVTIDVERLDEMMNEEEIFDERRSSLGTSTSEPATISIDTNFSWSEDFSSFTAQQESYLRVPGPTFSSQDPVEIFCKIWDQEFMETLCQKTNEYAWEVISKLSDPDIGARIPSYLDTWTDTTVEELYRYFAVLIYLSFCQRSKISEYWTTGVLGMPAFREIMSRNRYLLLTKFLHFVKNDNLINRGYTRKIEKVEPVIEHCNKKFKELYVPTQFLSLDESLLLWKGRLSWRQCIRSKAARFGIKSFELCEAETGYLLQYRLYAGKDTAMPTGPLHGFNDKTSKVVLKLMEEYLDAGHVLVMDNWYNQLSLTRYLKARRTDVLGTLNRRRIGIPRAIKDLNPEQLPRGDSVARHSGDIALVAWKDVKLVTTISTYHPHEMVQGRHAGQAVKPLSIQDYNRYMGGVDLKDQKLSMFLMERKRNKKWYMKVFRRFFNTSLLNTFIIYSRNPMYRVYSHREIRLKIAEGLLNRYQRVSSVSSRPRLDLRLQSGNHFPIYSKPNASATKKHNQIRCACCSARKKRTLVVIMCSVCKVGLCIGKCWEDFHTVQNLNI